jgi:hypothetical protein
MTSIAAEGTVGPLSRPGWGSSVGGALLATLEQPATWVLSLAGFLARGGLVAVLLPIVVLPTPAGIQNELSPILRPSVLNGEISPALVPLTIVAVSILVAVVLLGNLVGAWADVLVVRRAASALDAAPRDRRGDVTAALAVRLLAHAPLALALAWGGGAIYDATYAELLTPFEVTSPLVVRVAAAVPAVLVAVLVAWLLGETAGGLAVRELVLARRGVGWAVAAGWLRLVRRPLAAAATFALATVLVVVAVLPGLVAAATAWNRLRGALYDGRPEDIAVALTLFVGLWLGGLVLAAVATAARSALWTAEWLRQHPGVAEGRDEVGTIGGTDGTDRGGWPRSERSGTL